MDEREIVVVGAGLAGLACAQGLRKRGADVLVLEAAERIGGRVVTDEIDGFRCDRGFQVLNPAYQHLPDVVDVASLQLQQFARAVAVRTEAGLRKLADPTRRPGAILPDLRTGLITARALGLASFALRAMIVDEPRSQAFDRAGFGGPLRTEVVEPFLAGVVCEDDGSTSSRFTAWLLEQFAVGTPGVPAQGMGALPAAMAKDLEVWTHNRVEHVDLTTGEIRLPDRSLRARRLVLAAGPTATARLVDLPTPELHATRTFWFAADAPPTASTAIHVDGARRGPVTTTCVISNTAPTYAPPGRHLISALTLANTSQASEEEVRRHLAHIYGVGTEAWELVTVHDVPETLPALRPPFKPLPGFVQRGRAVLVGDQFGNASTEGALASGLRAVDTVLAP